MRGRALLAVAGVALAGCSAAGGGGGTEPSAATSGPQPTSSSTPATESRETARALRPPPTGSATPESAQARKSDAAPRYVFPVARCAASYGRSHHDYPAADIFARTGCPVVSVTDGVVDELSRRDVWTARRNDGSTRGGLSISIVGSDGVRYYFSHLSTIAPGITAGARVGAGDRIGSVGKTGSARGTPPHLHFGLSWPTPPGIWWIRRGVLQPAPFLDGWRRGKDTSPVKEILRLKKVRGETPPCARAC